MKIHTSYYTNIKKMPEDYFFVATSGAISQEIELAVDSWDKKLAPSKDIYFEYKESPDWRKYSNRFKDERLSKVEWLDMLAEWEEKANKIGKTTDNIVLLCYEKPSDFCHRQILGESIEKEFKTIVQEFGMEKHERVDYRIKPIASTDFLF